jgi:hypothetical protein
MLHKKRTNNQIQLTMKTSLRILKVLFLLIMISQRVLGQTGSDTEALLQKLADLKELKEQLPKSNDGTLKQLYILQDRVSFPANINVQIAGLKIAFVNKEQLANISDPYYLLFWDFRINQNRANTGFMLMSKSGINPIELIRVVSEAEKKGTEWVLIDVKVDKLR